MFAHDTIHDTPWIKFHSAINVGNGARCMAQFMVSIPPLIQETVPHTHNQSLCRLLEALWTTGSVIWTKKVLACYLASGCSYNKLICTKSKLQLTERSTVYPNIESLSSSILIGDLTLIDSICTFMSETSPLLKTYSSFVSSRCEEKCPILAGRDNSSIWIIPMSSILTARLVGGCTEQGFKCSQTHNTILWYVMGSVVRMLTKSKFNVCVAK